MSSATCRVGMSAGVADVELGEDHGTASGSTPPIVPDDGPRGELDDFVQSIVGDPCVELLGETFEHHKSRSLGEVPYPNVSQRVRAWRRLCSIPEQHEDLAEAIRFQKLGLAGVPEDPISCTPPIERPWSHMAHSRVQE